MATKELRMTPKYIDGDRSPEVVLEIYKGKQLQFATFVSASKKNGPYCHSSGAVSGTEQGKGLEGRYCRRQYQDELWLGNPCRRPASRPVRIARYTTFPCGEGA